MSVQSSKVIILFSWLMLGSLTTVFAQLQFIPLNGEDTTSVKTLPAPDFEIDAGKMSVPPPNQIQASDGDYDKYIRIVWQALGKGTFYKVYRGESEALAEMEPITDWVKSNYVLDFKDVVPGTTYHYRVVAARDSRQQSDHSKEDTGYARLMKPVAAPALAFPESSQDSIAIHAYGFVETPKAGGAIQLPFAVHNQSSFNVQQFSIKKYLSKDNLLDDEDAFLGEQHLEGMNAQTFLRGNATMELQSALQAGEYFLLLVPVINGTALSGRLAVKKMAVE